ncbi:MAG TPA: thioredoxin domain-containing protein [Bellilinea sp.]|nr:thioredoxin domain-containing protein [Bellilinea sp.]
MSNKKHRSKKHHPVWWKRKQVRGIAIAVVSLVFITAFLWDRNSDSSSPTAVGLDKSQGDPDALVTVIEYADFQCPYCGRFAAGPARQLEEEYVKTGKIRFVFRHFAFIGQESQWAAEAAECANEQNQFWAFYDKLFEEQSGENAGAFSKDNLKRFAVDLGLDTDPFNQCLDSGRYTSKVREETESGKNAGVRGTPTLFVNGKLVEDGSDYNVLKVYIDAALK